MAPANANSDADADRHARFDADADSALDDDKDDLPEPEESDPNRWLFAKAIKKGTEGGWATGSFDVERNRISITTRDVTAFSLHVDRIAINWDRLVVIRLDGHNSELRKRDHAVYTFARDRHGRWIVQEE